VAICTDAVIQKFGAKVRGRRPAAAGPALLETLTANFQGTQLSPVWAQVGPGVTQNGKLIVPVNAAYSGYCLTDERYNLLESRVFAQVVALPTVATSSSHQVWVVVQNADWANYVGFRFDIVSGSWRFRAWRQDNSVAAAIGTQIVYSLTTHKYLRIRETGSTIYLDTSPDASTWTNRWSLARPAWAANPVQFGVFTGYWNAANSVGNFELGNVNV
jgi:hypothetical protein